MTAIDSVGPAAETPRAGAPPLSLRTACTGTGALVRLALRRDRVLLPVYVAVVLLMVAVTYSSVATVYGTQAERDELAASMGTNSAFLALLGPLEHTGSVASTAAWRVGPFMILVLGVLAVLTVVRHTRKEEETGRLELVRAARVGSLAPLATGILVASGMSVLTGALMAAMYVAQGADGASSLAFGLQFAALGLAATGIGAVCAQVATSSRTANTIGVLLLVAGYALRGVADIEPSADWLHRVSPVGWVQEIDPFGANAWGPALLCVALLGVCVVVAARLSLGRDLGAGLVQPRPGPAESTSLASPLALATRLQVPGVVSWTLGVGAYCLLVGFLLDSVDDIAGSSPQMQQVIAQLGGAGALAQVFQVAIMGFVGIAAAAFAVTLVSRLHAEETSGRAEIVLATGVSRTAYLAASVVLLVVGVVAVPLWAGLMMGLGHALVSGGWGVAFSDAVGAGLVQIPAALVVAGLVLVLYGWWPRLVALGWGIVTLVLVVGQLGELFGLPQPVRDLSPFTHVPQVPLVPFSAGPVLALTAIAVVLVGVAAVGFRRRDVGGA
ncbi:ABC transporter permease [Oerskovia sp. Sa1BUA8]|uniref:ABC transporter permease n=1 Tax=Oerskovia douganii TaxID=2762210 RepID=A0A9D5U7Q1_9CELL|nr:ABC transporter permease [Oerskovia douganii]MBE7699076.1 ABC transporter permease [Oerskovia douganii]